MTIKREVNGQMMEFELTESEMWDAYREQEHIFDMEDARSWFDEMDDDSLPEALTDEQVDDAAYWARGWIDDNNHIAECRWDCIEDAIKEVLKNA